jgi:hypothetical protein
MCRTNDWGGFALAVVVSTFNALILCRHSCSYFMAATVEIASVSDTGTTKTTWSSRQCKVSLSFLSPPIGIPLQTTGLIHAILFNTLCFLALASHIRGAFSDPGRMPKGMVRSTKSLYVYRKHHSKVSSWKLRTARNARMVTRGNLLALITAQNAVFAFSR